MTSQIDRLFRDYKNSLQITETIKSYLVAELKKKYQIGYIVRKYYSTASYDVGMYSTKKDAETAIELMKIGEDPKFPLYYTIREQDTISLSAEDMLSLKRDVLSDSY